MAHASHGGGCGINRAKYVKVEKTVVDGRDQRVGHRMGEPHQIAVGPRRVDHDEIEGPLDRVDRIRELLILGIFVVGDLQGKTLSYIARACRMRRIRLRSDFGTN